MPQSPKQSEMVPWACRLGGIAVLVLAAVAAALREWPGAGVLAAIGVAALVAAARLRPRPPRAPAAVAAGTPSRPDIEAEQLERAAVISELEGLSAPELGEYLARVFRRLGYRVRKPLADWPGQRDDLLLERGNDTHAARTLAPDATVDDAEELARTVREGKLAGAFAISLEEPDARVARACTDRGITVVGPQRLAALVRQATDTGDGRAAR